ncbi:hypothetical protein [Altericista sp. CCNU0014]|uniref:hypothetical protein n=1 Tax=Altericista sp. CCNU0014 TaxID=3082949 RepID=UPI003851019B
MLGRSLPQTERSSKNLFIKSKGSAIANRTRSRIDATAIALPEQTQGGQLLTNFSELARLIWGQLERGCPVKISRLLLKNLKLAPLANL